MNNKRGQNRNILLRASRSRNVNVIGPVGGQLPIPIIGQMPEVVEVRASSESRYAPTGVYKVYTPAFYAKHPKDRNAKMGWFCTCPDHLFRGQKNGTKCKHMMKVAREYNI
jgi:hypothetical protein